MTEVIEDEWNLDIIREWSRPWTGVTKFYVRSKRAALASIPVSADELPEALRFKREAHNAAPAQMGIYGLTGQPSDIQQCFSCAATTAPPSDDEDFFDIDQSDPCLLYTSPSPRDLSTSRMPSSA